MFSHKPKHLIFLIHGIGGNKSHFGHMVKALRRILNLKDPSTKYMIKNIEYETEHDEKVPYDFAKDLACEINRYTNKPWFKKEDKLSLIMHSQGGLIGSIWMFQSLLGTEGYSSKKAINHLDAFITLGTPFWGAKIAQWGSEMKMLTKRMGIKVNVPFGTKQLEEMSFGSDMIYNFRQALVDGLYKQEINYLKDRVRFLNIVGVADILNPLGIFVSGVDKYEDDGAVPLTCARFNFLYSESIKDEYAENDRIPLDNTVEIDMAPYVVVNAMHLSPVPELANFPGIAQIPKKCIYDENHKHPTFSYLWKHILKYPIEQQDKKLGDFKTILIDLNVRAEDQTDNSCDDIHIEFLELDGAPLSANSNVELSKSMEFYSKGQRRSVEFPHHCRFYFTGHIKRSLDNRREGIMIKVGKAGYKSRYIEIKLKTACSTYVDINLLKNEE